MSELSAQSPCLLDQVLERDLDLVLMSALLVSESFRAFMLQSVIGWAGRHRLVAVRVSETATGGETDVLLVVDLEGANRLAVMVEDKISALFQPAQAERYRERGEQGIRNGSWNRFATCLCTPEGYFAAIRHTDEWDAYVALEAISEWVRKFGDRHLAFVPAICTQAVAKREGELRERSPQATAFWHAYRKLAAELLPEIGITRLADTVSDTWQWPRFGAARLPTDMFVEHKAQQGRVDLTFNGLSLEALKLRLHTASPLDVTPVKAGKSAALRAAVPRIDHLRAFEEQEEQVLAALAAVERLFAIGTANGGCYSGPMTGPDAGIAVPKQAARETGIPEASTCTWRRPRHPRAERRLGLGSRIPISWCAPRWRARTW